MNRCSILAGLGATSLVLCACHEGGSSATPAPPAVALPNLGVAAGRVEGNDWWFLVVGVLESAQGGRDLNGDGDALDEVAFAFDLARGTSENLGLSLSPSFPFPLVVCGSGALVVTSEAGQGGIDLNQDGDTSDDVLHVYGHYPRPSTLNTRLALAPFPIGSGAFAVSEAAQGNQDLNGDGDALDAVPRVFGPAGDVLGPSMAVTTLLGGSSFGPLWFTTDEAQLGSDLNGDGDALDPEVLQFYESSSGSVVNTGLDGTHLLQRSDAFMWPGGPPVWLVLVDERGRGLDLDGDGDADDFVAHLYERFTGIATNLGVACVPRPPLLEVIGGSFCVFARETDGLDRNGDGDFDDVTPLVIAGDRTSDTGLAIDVSTSGVAWSRGLVFDVSEAAQGQDLNGDGDRSDLVVHVGAVNLGLDSRGITGASPGVVIPRSELDSLSDWNGDGDRQDVVLFVHDVRTGETSNTGVAGLVLAASHERLLLAVPERDDGRDWNGDGDRDDVAYVHHDFALGTNVGLGGLLGSFPGSGRILPSGLSVVLVDEASMELDLNHDGDELDSVPFVWE